MGAIRDISRFVGAAAAAAGAAAAAYMVFEAQWPVCREADLEVPALPAPWSGLRVLHLSDVHAGLFPTNERSLDKVVDWAVSRKPDLVLLTGDMLGEPRRSRRTLELLARLSPPLGMFAVTGNHEYGLSKGPLAQARDSGDLWAEAGVTLLRDTCAALSDRNGTRLVLCGADHLTAGFGLVDPAAARSCPGTSTGQQTGFLRDLVTTPTDFPILLIHEPPAADSPLAGHFALTFAGHTHGGQLRVPSPSGLHPLVSEEDEFLSGVYGWAGGLLVVSRGVGTSFVPFRLLTRPEATLWRLV